MAILLYTTAIFTGLVYLIYRRLMPKPLPGIPYDAESAARISGNKPAIRAAYRQHGDFNTYRQELTHKLGWPLVQLFAIPGTRPILYLSDPREMEDIVLRRNKEFDRSSITSVIIGTIMPHSSIVKPSGPHHKAQRKPWADIMAPDFLRRIVAPSLYEAGLELIELWRTKSALADGAEIDILHDFDTAALDAIWVAVLGEKLGGLRDQIASVKNPQKDDGGVKNPQKDDGGVKSFVNGSSNPIKASGLDMQNTLNFMNRAALGWRSFTFPPLQLWLLKRGREYRRFDELKNRQIERLMRESVRRYQDAIAGGVEAPDRCAMDLVLRREVQAAHKSGVPLRDLAADVELRDEVFLLLWAGFDTTSNTLSWWTKYMARSPETQAKLRAALREALPGGPGRLPTVQEILDADVPYLDGAVEEALRLAGTATVVRQATVDTEILGRRVPKGTEIAFDSVTRRRPVPVPDEVRSATSRAAYEKKRREGGGPGIEGLPGDRLGEFLPERWLVEGKDGKMEFDAYALPRLAFGDGPRGCFGRRLALHELKIMMTLTILSLEMLPLSKERDNLKVLDTMFRKPKDCFAKFRTLS